MLGLRCRGRGRELFITVVYEIFLGGNIYMFGAEARQQEEGDISGNPPCQARHPAPSHADNIQINFLFLMEFFTACKCL